MDPLSLNFPNGPPTVPAHPSPPEVRNLNQIITTITGGQEPTGLGTGGAELLVQERNTGRILGYATAPAITLASTNRTPTTDGRTLGSLASLPPNEGNHIDDLSIHVLAAATIDTELDRSTFSPPAIFLASDGPRRREYNDDKGYDSEEPCFDAIEEEGVQDFDEDAVGEAEEDSLQIVANSSETAATSTAAASESIVIINNDAIDKLRVQELKDELGKRGLNKKGRKTELVQRLKEAMTNRIPILSVTAQAEAAKDDVAGFPTTAKWRTLDPQMEVVPEPQNRFAGARAPTVPEEDAAFVPVKHNFPETFDRDLFTGSEMQLVRLRNGRHKKESDGRIATAPQIRKKGKPNPTFLKTHELTINSAPVEFFEAFLPIKSTRVPKTKCSVERWCSFTNFKAQISFAGQKGYPYPDFKVFTVEELKQHIALYIFNGLSPSPRVEMKFSSQQVDPVNGNDFICRSFGPNAERRHRHFKAFFTMVDPRDKEPCRKRQPNYKVDHLLNHMNVVNQSAWLLGEVISVDEQTIGFQGNHKDKLRITYKAEGDGFQCDAMCQDGFTFGFFFRNHPAPKKFTAQGLSPLHSRVMSLFDCLKDKFHRCQMDNLYMSAKFARAAYLHRQKVLIAGVTRKGMRGLPKAVIQEEVKSRRDQLQVRGTVKAAVLEGDPDCASLVATSVYDTKPVHFLSMVCESICWVSKERQVFCVDTGKVELIRFLRLNINDSYNVDMGHVDVSDQLRNYYRFDHWIRKRKWWWSIAFWGIGVLLVNSYIVYCKVMQANSIPKKDWLSQYEFRKAIALAWINGEKYDSRRALQGGTKRKAATKLGHKTPSASKTARATDSTKRSSARVQLEQEARDKMEREEEKCESKRATRVSDSALSADGTLQIRFRRDIDHWPCLPQGKEQKCALHRWASGIEFKAGVMQCTTCGVHLCVPCFKAFHTIEDIVGKKKELATIFKRDQKVKALHRNAATTSDIHLQMELFMESLAEEAEETAVVRI
jgi:hypothetical protein